MSDDHEDDTVADDVGPLTLIDELDDGDLLVGFVEVVRYLNADGEDLLVFRAADASGTDLPLVETLGMLRLTEDTAIRAAMDAAL